jgi:2-oxoisovalerate dehydrogenase E1 component
MIRLATRESDATRGASANGGSAASDGAGSQPDALAPFYETGLVIRAVEERLLKLFSEGRLFGTVHTCIGQEMAAAAVGAALRSGDVVCSNHRGHGHYLARTDDVEGLIAEVMGRQTGVCGGRGGSQHLHAPGFYSNGILGGMAPVAAGIAFSQKLSGSGAITALFLGDGALGEGTVYETFNIASRWELPLLVVVENNRYAQSTCQSQTLAGSIAGRASAFGIGHQQGDTWHPAALIEMARECADSVRQTGRPHVLQIDTYRLMAHSKGDDDRDPAEVAAYRERDPLTLFLASSTEARLAAAAASERVEHAVQLAEAAPYPGSQELAADPEGADVSAVATSIRTKSDGDGWIPTRIEFPDRAVNLIYESFQRSMARDDRIMLLGEDIEGPYGGAFKVTRDLKQQYPERVFNTPISEAAIVGLGNGLALEGFIPVCELMFGDFLALAADQLINHAAKFQYMYNDRITVPLIVRTPMGGRRGYGPTHSQSLEKHFLGLPGTRVLALHGRSDPGLVYETLFRTIDRPVLVLENKLLYGSRVSAEAPAGFILEHDQALFPTSRLRPEAAADVTLFCYGGMLPEVERAVDQLVDEQEIVCEVICPLQIYPLDVSPVLESVRSTRHLLIVEEGQMFAALGSELLARIVEQAPGALERARRIGPPSSPIPSCGPLEQEILPGARHIARAVQDLVHSSSDRS